MSGASSGAFLVQSKISAVLHAYLMPFLASDSQAHFRKKVKVHISSWFSPSAWDELTTFGLGHKIWASVKKMKQCSVKI